jgi:RNA polymerase sigma-70 factor (ECF subfamily)
MTTDANAGDRRVEEVQRLFLRHAGVLRGFILALLPDHHLAEDVLQDVFLTVTRKAGEFQPGTNFLAWARAIGRLKVLEQCRRHSAAPQLLDPEVMEVLIAEAPAAEEEWAQRRQALAECLEQLTPRAREIFELRYSDDLLPPPEIAARVHWTVDAVHVALARARKFLRDCTQRRLAAGGA